jgi:hypothetical protein
MTTTICNIENSRGNVKVVLYIEGEHQLAHIYLNDQIVSQLKFKKDQDIDINLIEIIQNNLANANKIT